MNSGKPSIKLSICRMRGGMSKDGSVIMMAIRILLRVAAAMILIMFMSYLEMRQVNLTVLIL